MIRTNRLHCSLGGMIGAIVLAPQASLAALDEVTTTAERREAAHPRYITPEGRWEFAVFGKNLTDQEYRFTGFDFSTFNSVFAADPMTYRAAVTVRYD